MRILDRHVLHDFSVYLSLGLIGFIVIFGVVDLFDKIDVFLDHHASAGTVARFYLHLAPDVVVKVMPVALLLATFLALGQLNKFGELTAMRVAGQSLMRILLPVWVMAFLCTGLSFALSELVVPASNRERDRIYHEQIQGITQTEPIERGDVSYLGRGGHIYLIRLYLIPERRMRQVTIQRFQSGVLLDRVDASDARWENGRWVFYNGTLRRFASDGEHAEAFDRREMPELSEKPEDFSKEPRSPEEMNFRELRQYIDRLRGSGSRVANYLVDLHVKLAFPLINIIVVAIGASLATRLRAQSAALGFGLSVAIAFVYYGLMRTTQALGHNGTLPPYFAAWLPDLLFGIVGGVMLVRAQRR